MATTKDAKIEDSRVLKKGVYEAADVIADAQEQTRGVKVDLGGGLAVKGCGCE